MNNWFRPSIQQPRWIAQAVRSAFAPIMQIGNTIKDYWDTWHQVYQPTRKDDEQ